MEVTKADITGLYEAIDAVPQKIFDTKIKVKNGTEKEVRFLDIVTLNHERTSCLEREIKEGSILVPIRDANNTKNFMSLTDILTTLYLRPTTWFSKSAKFSDNVSKMFKFVFEVSLIIYAIYSIFKAVQP